MAGTMRAVEIKGGKGELDALYISPEAPKPVPAEGQALVKVRAFGINRMDIIQRRGNYPLPPQAPATLGVEFSGVVESLGGGGGGGGDHHGFRVGDEVFGLAYGGAYAEFVAVDAGMLLRKPAHLTFEQAAALPEAWITATQALHAVLGFAPGRSILWHAGASGVSTAGIQLARLAGASAVYATAGSDAKCRYVTGTVGATAAFNYKTQDWVDEVRRATGGRGVDHVVDFVGGAYFGKNLEVAARDGRIVMLGTLGGALAPPDVDVGAILYKRLRVEGSTLRSRDLGYQRSLRDRLEGYLPDFDEGRLKIVIDTVLPWEQIQDAHRHMEEGNNSGKIVCTIGL